jgi:hypothetical protein
VAWQTAASGAADVPGTQWHGVIAMGEWEDQPLTFDRSSDAWGSVSAGFDGEAVVGDGGGEAYLELIGSQLWVAGMVDLGRFRRVSDFINIVQGYIVVRDAVVLSRSGEASRLAMPELRVLPDDLSIVGLADDNAQATSEGSAFIEKRPQRLALLTRSHLIDGEVLIQADGSVMTFVDATDPRFIPMADVRVRWLSDRTLAARYPSALVQRSQIQGVATEGITLGGADETVRQVAALKAQVGAVRDADGLDGDIGPTGTARGAGTASGGAPQAG